MKNLQLIIWCGLVLLPLSGHAQKEKKIGSRIGFEMGFHEFFGSTIAPDRVRSTVSVDVSEYYTGGYENQSSHVIHKLYVGLKYEALLYKNKFGISSGIRLAQLSAQLDHNRNYDYFIWLLHQEERTANYVTIRDINQKNYYVCIPLEFRLFLSKIDRLLKNYVKLGGANSYVKLGGALNYRFSTVYDTDFQDTEMSKHAGEVENQILKPCTYSGFIYPAFGFRWGRNKNPWVNVEFQFPGFIIAQRKHSFVNPDFGLGMQLSVQLPLNKTTQ